MRWADTRFEPVAWSEIDGWAADDHAAAFATFLASCRPLAAAKNSRDTRPVYPALAEICRKARGAGTLNTEAARKFFEEHFARCASSKIDDPNGFLTGYYEPIVDGSRTLTDDFKVPVYARPRDLVHMGRKRKAESFPNTGRVVRRIARGKYVPYFDRAQIEDGALATRKLELAYLKDANDLLFIQIQGSARIRLTDGSLLRVNYDAHNGHPYTPVGRILIERGIIKREDMSMDAIRKWMAENPDGGRELRRQNKSFVFFRATGAPENEEARGAQGVPLTAEPLDRGRPRAACLRHAVLHRRGAADRGRRVGDEIPQADDRAGHRLGDRRAGARRHLFRRGRRGGQNCGPHQEPGALRDADAEGARSGGGRQGDAAARAAARERAEGAGRGEDRRDGTGGEARRAPGPGAAAAPAAQD